MTMLEVSAAAPRRRNVAAAKAKLLGLLRARRAGLVGALTLTSVLLIGTPFGSYIDTTAFYRPANKLRAALELSPELDPSIRLVVVDDASIRTLGRQPSFSEWRTLAGQLFALGFERVFLHAFPNLSSDVDPSLGQESLGQGALVSAAARFSGIANPRTIGAPQIPPDRLVNRRSERTGFDAAPVLLGPAPEVIPHIHSLGHINLNVDESVPLAFDVGPSGLLPHLSLWSVPGLTWHKGRFRNQFGEIPFPHDRTLRVDFVSPMSVAKASLPFGAFFNKDRVGALKKRLEGGKLALLVPDGYSGGSQFVASPFGLVPSYFVSLSLANGVLSHRYIVHPASPTVLTLIAALFVGAFFWYFNARSTTLGALAFVIVGVGASFAIVHIAGWILPTASFALLTIVAASVDQIYRSISIWKAQITSARDLELGRVVQSLILPRTMTGRIGSWEYNVAYEPFGPMSGDWVQIYEAPESHRAGPLAVIAIGDVVGKGPSAALNTAAIASAWANFQNRWTQGEFSVERFMAELNFIVHKTFSGEQLSTMSLAILEESSCTLVNCSAPSWMRIDTGAKMHSVGIPPMNPLGMCADLGRCRQATVSPNVGDVILAYTDGVMEGQAARRTFGRHLEAAGLPESDVFSHLVREARIAGKGNVLPDDFTILMIRRAA